ncbi:hypothetical protein NON00_07165 [Roseomonas sp. GC11]|uniref:hypothetical protein n=1 Tax=Roseomonas sp. GC11 TaxID=2950546 RepID=UPI00210C4F81|nr:hypothetical protein [Roseomonas sp. GC11]MCQ4159704.1 hypothetical protein [Roseomonas sp. GC11]
MRLPITALALAALLAAPAALAQGTAPPPGTPPTGDSQSSGSTAPAPSMGMTPAPRGGDTAPAPRGGDTAAARPGTDNPPTTTSPNAGANSFTEGQARSRIEAAGYTDVQDLKKDGQGIWRARAMREGTPAEVGLDFQGKVVIGPAVSR